MRQFIARLDPISTFATVAIAAMIAVVVATGGFLMTSSPHVGSDGARAHQAAERRVWAIVGAAELLVAVGVIVLGRRALETSRSLRASEERQRLLLEQASEARLDLERSQHRYHELADALPQPVFETDATGRLTFANHAALTTFGYDEERPARGLMALDVIAPEDRERGAINLRRRLAGEGTGASEYRMLRSDGTTFTGIMYADPILCAGRVVGARGIILDISERKVDEQHLRERLLFEEAVAQASALLMAGEADLEAVARVIGRTLDVDRVNVVQFVEGGFEARSTASWHARPEAEDPDFLPEMARRMPRWWTPSQLAGAGLVIGDVGALPEDRAEQRERLRGFGVHALVAVPVLTASGEPAGLIGLQDMTRARTWQPEHGRLLELMAQRLATYWQRQAADAELRLTNARLSMVASVGQRLSAGAAITDAIQASCDDLRELLGYEYVEVFLTGSDDEPDAGGGRSLPCSAINASAHVLGDATPMIGHSRRSRRYGSEQLVEFRGRDEVLALIADLAPPGEEGMAELAPRIGDILGVSYVCQVPLLSAGRLVGHLAVGLRDARGLSDGEKRFLTVLGQQLGLVIAKACAENALRESEQRYRMLFNSGGDAMFVHRLHPDGSLGGFIAVNDTACERYGYTRAEFLTMSPDDLRDPSVSLDKRGVVGRLQAEGRAVFEVLQRTRAGELIPEEISAHLFTLDGRPTVLSVARDLTERKHHEERLRKINECFLGFRTDPGENIQALTAACGEVLGADWATYVRLGADGSCAGTTCEFVAECTARNDWTGLLCREVMAAARPDVVAAGDLQRSSYAASDPNIYRLGARSYLGQAVQPHDGPPGAVCVFFRRDVVPTESDRRLMGIIAGAIRVEEERRHAHDDRERARAEAEAANRLKSEFLANTSHEIRTPLNGIIGYLQLVRNGLYDSPAEQREFLEGAAESARHLLLLINDVLDVAKIDAGKLRVEPAPVSLAALLDEARGLVRVQAEQAGLELTVVPVADDLTAWCDEERLKQVLVNLLGNAVKFTPAGGTVTVSALSHPDEGAIRVEVRDTGIGIAPDKLEAIFGQFVQADGSTTRLRGGTGLGLTISRRLVEMMGGTMSAHSAGEGQGATFSFTVPLYRGAQLAADRSDAA